MKLFKIMLITSAIGLSTSLNAMSLSSVDSTISEDFKDFILDDIKEFVPDDGPLSPGDMTTGSSNEGNDSLF